MGLHPKEIIMKTLSHAIRPLLLIAALPAFPMWAACPPALAQSADAAAIDPADQMLSLAQIKRDIALAKDAYAQIHPGYTRYASATEMEAAWAGILSQAEATGGMTVGEFYLAVELVLTRIRCDHTKAELPKALAAAREGQPLYLPFRWELVEGRGMIDIAGEGTGLSRGDEILSIDGRPLEDVVAATSKYIPVDGYTEWSRNREISQSREFMGGAVDHFGALLWDIPSEASLELRSVSGEVRSVAVPRIDHKAWTALGAKAGQPSEFKDAVEFERIGDNAAYLSVDTFVNYRVPVEPQSLYGPVFSALRNEGRDTLILDLRENGGGSTDASLGLTANLIPDARPFMTEFRVATLDHSPWEGMIGTWDPRALNPDPRGFVANDDGSFTLRDGIMEDTGLVTPTDVAFEGRLIILTSKNNSSGSTNLLAHLAERENTITIGEKTGGSAEGPNAGVIFFLTLPESDMRLRIPMFRQWNNVASFEQGMGVTPEISAPMTYAAFVAGEDPALEQAKQIAASDWTNDNAAAEGLAASASDFALLEGEDWSGELEYLNYGREDRSTIPVRMVVREAKNGSIPYGFLYPGEEHKNAREKFRISKGGTQINGQRVTERYINGDGALVIVTEGQGRDDNRAADIRFTYIIGENSFINRKDVRFEEGEYFNRNEYRLTR